VVHAIEIKSPLFNSSVASCKVVQHCLRVEKRVWSSMNCILVTLNVKDDDDEVGISEIGTTNGWWVRS